jgi:hypothetical protein
METKMAQIKPVDGQGMAVDFEPIVRVIEAKLTADFESLKSMLARSNPAVRDFAQQNRLLSEVQASLRAVDVLTGRTNLTGQPNPHHAGIAAIEHALSAGAGNDKDAVDISTMAKKLAPRAVST